MFVVYHKDTTRYLAYHPKVKTNTELFSTAAAAKAAITREHKRGAICSTNFLVADSTEFHNSIEKNHPVKNLMSGATVMERVNTPYSCSVGSEAYWSQ